MSEPKAKYEIYAEANKNRAELIDFWYSTQDGKEWLAKEIPKFMEGGVTGSDNGVPYGLRENDTIPGKGWFVVNKCFDAEEVLDYINGNK